MDTVLGVLCLLVAGVTVAYWADFFIRGTVHVVEEEWWIRFEKAFPVADAFMAVAALVAGVGLLGGDDFGVAFGLAAGGALVFLGLMDLTFNVQNGLFRLLPGSGQMWAELVIVVGSLAIGGLLIGYLAGRVG